jgi:type I restriction enzyme M protein
VDGRVGFSRLPRTEAGIYPAVPRERSMSYLKPEHQQRVADAYHAFKDVEGFAKVASLVDIRTNDGNLSIPLYVRRIDMRGKAVGDEKGEYAVDGLKAAVTAWEESSEELENKINALFSSLR